jgi:hypothetical protein
MTKDYVLVSTISTFHHRFVMHKDDLRKLGDIKPSDKDLLEWAMDSVTMEECDAFAVNHVAENIVEAQEWDEDEMLTFFDRDNNYMSGWDREAKIEWVRNCLKVKE